MPFKIYNKMAYKIHNKIFILVDFDKAQNAVLF
jgi:hypothetical protein